MGAFRQVDEAIRILASRNHSVALRQMNVLTGKRIAVLLNITESTVSDFKGEDLEKAMQFLAALGLKCVHVSEITKSPDDLRHLLRQARSHIERELEELGSTGHGALGGPEL